MRALYQGRGLRTLGEGSRRSGRPEQRVLLQRLDPGSGCEGVVGRHACSIS